MENKNQIICEDCGIEYDKNEYYLSRIKGKECPSVNTVLRMI